MLFHQCPRMVSKSVLGGDTFDISKFQINANKTCFSELKISQLKLFWLAIFCVISPDIAASEPIANMLLNAEESWLQRLADPSAPLPSTDQSYDGGSHDINTPVKNLWVLSQTYCNCLVTLRIINHVSFTPHFSNSFSYHSIDWVFNSSPSYPSLRNLLGVPISKRDSLLEKCAMFREAGGALSRQPSQDNGLDDPFSSGTSKLEQVHVLLTVTTWKETQ